MSQPTFTVADIRKTFLDFFASKGHTIVASSPLVPGNDPTLMFTNSGMVQFKDVFLGEDKRPYVRATSVQACLRAGGKHNDLENVGYTARHHTFFEMLGNWSFGDYFKRESLQWAWELLTQVYKLPPERLLATVYAEDDEAYDIWTKDIGLPPERVIRIGDNKGGRYKSDNFWMMADTGPCGPCSEIFYDHGPGIPGGPPGSPDEDGDRFIEIWNNVFMQFDMAADGSVTRLPAPCVDTGMGLERLAAILQHVHSNYEIDLFDALIRAAARETGEQDLGHNSLRVIADHIRATAFLVTDGVIPSNEGRGYVQRRIVRRAIRHGYKLGQKKPFFHRLVPDLVALMGDAYPKLVADEQRIVEVLKAEEERFFETLANGMEILDAALGEGATALPGDVAFKLHDTFGFPLDLTQDVCRERDVGVDVAGFDAAMQRQKAAGRAAGKFRMDRAVEYAGAGNVFTGYEHLEEDARVVALYVDGTAVGELVEGQPGIVVLDTTPFYSESGGQVGDQGFIGAEGVQFGVEDTQKIKADVFGHHGVQTQGTLRVGDAVKAAVDGARRAATQRNHSVTHLMHKALRDVLGTHVQQKGSLVAPDRLRFDFAHFAPISAEDLAVVERNVNAQVRANNAVEVHNMAMQEALDFGAMALFGEKYGENVRVLKMGDYSTELCGGTHVGRTGDIGLFKITSEGGVSSGVRRIEAVTGQGALDYVAHEEAVLGEAATLLGGNAGDVVEKIRQLGERQKKLERELDALKAKRAAGATADLGASAVEVNGIKILAARLEGFDAKALRDAIDRLKQQLGNAVIVLAGTQDGKAALVAGVNGSAMGKVKAGELLSHIASQIGGKGGGRPDLAQGGGEDGPALASALAAVVDWVTPRI